MAESRQPFLIITGPTAVGKTTLSLLLARHLGAEIISADSRQIYRELDIGTAKPTPRERAVVPHHFIDELDLDEPFSAGRFADAANERIEAILKRGRTPLVVGGSTLYLHALKTGLADIPDVPAKVREQLIERLELEGAERLFAQLQKVDPGAADTMDPTKTQRIVRALEVFEATGRTLTSFQDEHRPPPFSFRTVVLHRPRARLYERIERRVDEMLESGLLDEVRGVLRRGIDADLNPLRTIGYREPIAYLEGRIDRAEMIRLMKRNTRRYAKRQLTWFRRDERNEWVDARRPQEALMETILRD